MRLSILSLKLIAASSLVLVAAFSTDSFARSVDGGSVRFSPSGVMASTDLIDWAGDLALTFSDFRGTPPANPNLSMSVNFLLNYTWHVVRDSRGRALRVAVTVKTQFDAGASWVDAEWLTHPDMAKYLTHVNGRFDLIEIYLRDFETRAEALSVAGLRDSVIAQRIEALFEDVKDELGAEEVEYDAAANWGLNEQAEAEWTAEFQRRLGL